MDVFQLIGDFLHLIAVLMLLLKILANKNVIGISYKTQEIYLIVFITRYSDMLLEHHWGSIYFNSMRFIFIGISVYTIYVMRFKRPYLMVLYQLSRAMTHNQIRSLIGFYISHRLFWPSSSTKILPYMACCGLFLSGCKLQPFCLNFTW